MSKGGKATVDKYLIPQESLDKAKSTYTMNLGRKWTDADEQVLRECCVSGVRAVSYENINKFLRMHGGGCGRSKTAIQAKIGRLKAEGKL